MKLGFHHFERGAKLIRLSLRTVIYTFKVPFYNKI